MQRWAVLTIILILVLHLASAAQADTSFSYQGRLESAGTPTSGTVDMVFKLFDAKTDGAQVGPSLIRNVEVQDGLFHVDLDFGSVFDGSPRFVEVTVNDQALSPRQAVRSVPLTTFALDSASSPSLTHGREDSAITITTPGLQDIQSLVVDVPAKGHLHITASALIYNNSSTSIANLLIRVDATSANGDANGPGFAQRLAAGGELRASMATHTQNFVLPVDEGTYTLTMKVSDNTHPIDYRVEHRTITAVWYPDALSAVALP